MSSIIKRKKKQDKYTLSKADIDFYKMTGVFAIACIFVLLALRMQGTTGYHIASGKDLTYNFYMFCRTPMFIVMGLLMLCGSAAWFIYCKVKKIDESKRIFTSANCFVIVLYLGFFTACFGITNPNTNHTFFIATTICAAVLFYVSKFYNMDFVAYSIVSAVFAMAITLTAMRFEIYMIVIKLIVVACGVAFCVLFHKKIDSLKVSKQKKASFLKAPVYVPLCVGTLFLFWAGITPLQSLLFLNRNGFLMVMLLQYIVFAVVYTIRRIKD